MSSRRYRGNSNDRRLGHSSRDYIRSSNKDRRRSLSDDSRRGSPMRHGRRYNIVKVNHYTRNDDRRSRHDQHYSRRSQENKYNDKYYDRIRSRNRGSRRSGDNRRPRETHGSSSYRGRSPIRSNRVRDRSVRNERSRLPPRRSPSRRRSSWNRDRSSTPTVSSARYYPTFKPVPAPQQVFIPAPNPFLPILYPPPTPATLNSAIISATNASTRISSIYPQSFRFYNERLTNHTTCWPSDIFEKQAEIHAMQRKCIMLDFKKASQDLEEARVGMSNVVFRNQRSDQKISKIRSVIHVVENKGDSENKDDEQSVD